MAIKGCILDLDGTIVDSTCLDALRDKRKWKECVAGLHGTICFGDLHDVLHRIATAGIRIGIVTNSVSFYADAMIKHHALPCDARIAWHDTRAHKPHPAPVLACKSCRSALRTQ